MARRIWGKRYGGSRKHQMGRMQQLAVLVLVLAAGVAAAALLGGSSYAITLVSGPTTDTTRSLQSTGPSISSDLGDYSPGATVTLTGRSWAANETVHVVVNDNEGQTWNYANDVVADDSGDFTLTFTLPTSFVANYGVKATAPSGSASTSFTDASLKIYPAPSGVSFTLTYQGFTNSACSTGAGATDTMTVPNDTGG